MANYNDLITAIDSVIKTNNRREITGQLLQNVLNTMVGSLGENYQLAGFATPTTNPHQPDQNVFYVASQAGVYTQFDNIVLGDGISFLMWKNGAWTSQTIANVTQSWVQQNFVSKEWFRKVFRVYDEDGLEIVPNDMDSVVDNIKAMVGLWTNEYLSALGMGRDGGGTTQTLAQLNDVQLGTLENGDALVYNTAIHKWENKQIQTGVDMSVVWAALAANTNEQINASHLATALSGYVTSTNLSTMLNDYATKSWVNQNFITVEWFDKLFKLYNGAETDVNKIAPNGTLPSDPANLNIEAMFGFWTKKYISALGNGDDGTTSYTTLAQLNDVTLTNPTADQVLSYNGTHWVNRSIELGSQTLADLTDVVITSPAANQMLGYDATTQKWKNIAIPATGVTSVALSMPTGFSITGSPITASGTFTVTFASGYSLPTTAKQSNWDTAYGWGDHASAGYVKSSGVTKVSTGTGLTGGDITSTGTISIDSTYQTYISHGNTAYGWGNHANAGYAAASSLSNYLPLSGGTITGTIYANTGSGLVVASKSKNQPFVQGIRVIGSVDTDYWTVISLQDSTTSNLVALVYNTSSLDANLQQLRNGVSKSLRIPYENGVILHSGENNLSSISESNVFGVVNNKTYIGFTYTCEDNINWSLGSSSDSNGIFTLWNSYSQKRDFVFTKTGRFGIGVLSPSYELQVNGNIAAGASNGNFVQIGNIRMMYDSANNAIKVVKSDGTAANFYATGGVSALGAGQESGGGGSYLPLSGGTLTGYLNINYNSSPQLLTLKNTSSGDVNIGFRLSNTYGYNIGAYTTASPILYVLDTRLDKHVLDINDGTTCLYHPAGPVANVNRGYVNVFRTCCYDTNYYGMFVYMNYDGTCGIQAQRESNKNETFSIVLNPYGGGVAVGSFINGDRLSVDGAVGARGFNNLSDIRTKNVIKDVDLRLDQIAKAPAFEYYWLDQSIDHDLHVGTSAQYWEGVLPQVVTTAKDEIGTKAMQYGVAALISAITVARKVMTHEEKIALLETRVSALEKENGEQEMLINSLQEELAKFKAA